MSHAKIITVQLIATTTTTGKGTEKDPVRIIQELWSTSGNLVCSYDPVNAVEPYRYVFEQLLLASNTTQQTT